VTPAAGSSNTTSDDLRPRTYTSSQLVQAGDVDRALWGWRWRWWTWTEPRQAHAAVLLHLHRRRDRGAAGSLTWTTKPTHLARAPGPVALVVTSYKSLVILPNMYSYLPAGCRLACPMRHTNASTVPVCNTLVSSPSDSLFPTPKQSILCFCPPA
jgi:hypothetical protein